jgi:hypothetical protein
MKCDFPISYDKETPWGLEAVYAGRCSMAATVAYNNPNDNFPDGYRCDAHEKALAPEIIKWGM